MPPFTACVACRRLKSKCKRDESRPGQCVRCKQLAVPCEVVSRKLGRKLGSKNRPKVPRPPGEPAVLKAPQRSYPRASSCSSSLGHSADLHGGVFTPPNSHASGKGPAEPGGGTMSRSASVNLLHVLARVANDQPLQKQPPSESPVGLSVVSHPFHRSSFLSDFRKEARRLDPDPFRGMAVLEEGLDALFKPVEAYSSIPGDEIVYGSIDAPRLDNAPEHDVVHMGLLTEAETVELMDVYWARIHPVTRALDPEIHSLGYLRSKSASLTTVVLMLAGQCLPVSQHSSSLVARLESHFEFLLTQTDKSCYQSLEICQAVLMFVLYLGGHKLNRAWPLATKAMSMAVELRLDVSPPPKWALAPSAHHSASKARLVRNVERLWLLAVDWDRASAFLRGRQPMIREHPSTLPPRLIEWNNHPEALDCDAMTAGSVQLFGMFVGLQLEANQLPVDSPSFDFSQHVAGVDAELDRWRAMWFPRLTREDQKRSEIDLEGFRFILIMAPYVHGTDCGWLPAAAQASREACLSSALSYMTHTIPILSGTDPLMTVTSVYSYRFYRIVYPAFCVLCIIGSSPRTSDHDVFLLSVIALLAQRLIDLRLHENRMSISRVLGQRLMSAARRLAATRLPNELDRGAAGDALPFPVAADTESVMEGLYDFAGPLAAFMPGYSEGIFAMLDPTNMRFGVGFDMPDHMGMSFVDASAPLS